MHAHAFTSARSSRAPFASSIFRQGRFAAPILGLVALAGRAPAQVVVSIDSTSQTIGVPAALGGTPITAGDLLQPVPGGMPSLTVVGPPSIYLTSGAAGLGLDPMFDEVDALSWGADHLIGQINDGDAASYLNGRLWFSVDRTSQGQPLSAWPNVPHVRQQYGQPSDADLHAEQSADLFVPFALPAPGTMPDALGHPNVGAIDGNGAPDHAAAKSFAFPGLGLIEPTPIPPGVGGDNVDAIDILSDLPSVPSTVYFSLDQASAAHHGPFLGGAILRHTTGIPGFGVYASPNSLGLDRVAGPGSDDLDAIALWDNGDGFFVASNSEFDWLAAPFDMVLFSVTRSSAVVGQMDSLLGIPIEPGDVLIPPVLGGFSNLPAIFFPAEFLGLRTTRSHGIVAANVCDLDALDLTGESLFDCNGNAIEDALDIAQGIETDLNENGLPDECDPYPRVYCTAKVNSQGCAPAISYSGTANLTAPNDFHVLATDIVNSRPGLLMWSFDEQQIPFAGGWLCIETPIKRFAPLNAGGTGGAAVDCTGSFDQHVTDAYMSLKGWTASDTIYFQFWYRDPLAAMQNGLTDALEVPILP